MILLLPKNVLIQELQFPKLLKLPISGSSLLFFLNIITVVDIAFGYFSFINLKAPSKFEFNLCNQILGSRIKDRRTTVLLLPNYTGTGPFNLPSSSPLGWAGCLRGLETLNPPNHA